MHLDYSFVALRQVKSDYLGHQVAVREITHYVLFGLGQWHPIDPCVEIFEVFLREGFIEIYVGFEYVYVCVQMWLF